MNQNSSSKNVYVLVGLVVVGVILLLALAASYNSPANETKKVLPKGDTQKKLDTAVKIPESTLSEKKSSVKEFTLEAGSFYYKPNIIKVKEGETVKVTIKSVDMMHNFYLDEFGVKSDTAKSGETKSVEFVASKKGTFEFYCGVGQHRAKGQVGSLIVE